MKNTDEWKIFKLKRYPGLIIIKNPFTSVGQRYWIKRLLRDYTKNHPNNLLETRFKHNVIKDFWTSWNEEGDEQQKRLIKKSMRWTTLGYHYDWTNKIYSDDNKDEFPKELYQLVEIFANVLGYDDYKSEAAIVNFYPIGSTLSAHTDHSEICDAPLFSISFGQSAIFLIGGTTKEEEPTPILLNSGDVVIMAGDTRFSYHAVPRVFKANSEPWNHDSDINNCKNLNEKDLNECLNNEKFSSFNTYLLDSRINVNVRQFKK